MTREERKRREMPTWLIWILRILLAYVIFLAIILAITIISILITFSFVVVDLFTDSNRFGAISDQYLVPLSEFMWDLFTFLIPGL
ncbi:hypothetical protein [Alkalihalobacillus hemicellulosilyticus]|uniref:Uncharacterized protein n=1 Tax=Halalkalibacter hemicellulosilyticusJCM 9152 TaxID=1236971 RepID=W4QAP7_9BACI|nr:hypothetical protein [Halalkalibacter hemicellulosilyticus]GAE29090.1 hypothetical protein JCM9152_430 [Halalkalibacter hemicellulosilyticusJCM 9152]